ncbi:hypothetical protein R1flu_004583 [Riccia fluitans]|uniref:Uncharacterized protein n=1 Tax=Riccia fluitans TaxID=41844 RepID=A0ABD1YRP9_9MARC
MDYHLEDNGADLKLIDGDLQNLEFAREGLGWNCLLKLGATGASKARENAHLRGGPWLKYRTDCRRCSLQIWD